MPIGGKFLRPHECQIMYQASRPDVVVMKDGTCEKCLRSKEKLKAEHTLNYKLRHSALLLSEGTFPVWQFQNACPMLKSVGVTNYAMF